MSSSVSKSNEVWGKVWSYQEGFLVAAGLFLAGLAIEIVNGTQSLPSLIYPDNVISASVFISLLIANYFLFQKTKWIWFLRSVPAAISAIGLFAFNALLMGLFLQDNNVEGWKNQWALSHVTNSWYYLLSSLYLLITLGTLVLNKIHHFKWSELGITVSHLGLWLALFAGSMGSFEVSRLEMRLVEGEMTFVAQDRLNTGKMYEMPFVLKLNDFILEEYPPKMGIVDNESGVLLHAQGRNIRILEEEDAFEILGYKIQVKEYLEYAKKFGDAYYYVREMGAPQAVRVISVSPQNDTVKGWVSCGSFNSPYESLKLSDKHSLVMMVPEPKNYISKIEIHQPSGKTEEIQLEVNQAHQFNEWKIYQLSFADEFGKWSDISVVELVRDPWLPLVYTGVFLMLAGAIYMFWFGRSKNQKSE